MAIQPIDLQTMYSQMTNVANRVAHEQNGGQLAQSINQQSVINQNAEKAQAVQKTASNDAKASVVKKDSKGNGGFYGGARQNGGTGLEDSEDEQPKKKVEIRESFLGQHIDITR